MTAPSSVMTAPFQTVVSQVLRNIRHSCFVYPVFKVVNSRYLGTLDGACKRDVLRLLAPDVHVGDLHF